MVTMTEGEALELSEKLRKEGPEVLEDAEKAVARLGRAVARTVELAERCKEALR